MSGGDISDGGSDFRNGQVGFRKQLFRLFTADSVVIPQKGTPGLPLEDPGQIIAVHKEGCGDAGKGKLLVTVFPDKVTGLAGQALSGSDPGGNSLAPDESGHL